MIKLFDEPGTIKLLSLYSICELYSNVFLFAKKIRMYFWVKKGCVVHNVHQLLFRTRFFALTKFSILNGGHMDVHLIL